MDIKISNVSKSFEKRKLLKISHLRFLPEKYAVCLNLPVRVIQMPNLKILKKIGYMPQNDALYDDLSAESNLRFFGGLYHLGKSKLDQRIEEVLELVDLTEHRKKLVRNFSGGMKKRLSLAASILHQPDVLFLDEPTVGIDPVLRRTIWDQFQEIKKSGTTIIVSTHVMDEVTECDKAALIYNGSLIEYDSVEKLLKKPIQVEWKNYS